MNIDRLLDVFSEQMGMDKRSLLAVLQGSKIQNHSIDIQKQQEQLLSNSLTSGVLKSGSD